MSGRAPTMQDVARLANVSIATVSFMVNGTKPVSEPTRVRIEDAIRKLGYRPNAVARALASRRTRIIALLYPALQQEFSWTASKFFISAAKAAGDLGYSLVLWPVDNDTQQLSKLVSEGLVEGVILMEVQLDDVRVTQLLDAGIPFSLIGRTREPEGLAYVDVDFDRTLDEAVEYLAGLGHRRICLVRRESSNPALAGSGQIHRGEVAFEKAMKTRGLDGVVIPAGTSPEDGHEAAGALLRRAPGTTAAIVMSEHVAAGFVRGLGKHGVHVPNDMSVLLIGSSPEIAAMTDPQLTIMISPSVELGRMGVEALIDKLEDKADDVSGTLLTCVLAPGFSTGPAPVR